MTGIRLRHESTLKDDEIEWEKKTAMLFLECLSGRSLREAKVDPVHLTVYLFLSTSGSNARGESRALEGRRVSSKSPSRVQDGDEGVAGRKYRE